MAFDSLVRFFFADNGLSAGLAKANAQLGQLGRQGPGARVGLKAVETGMRSLAFEAVGLSGGVGRVAEGILRFGGGSALVIGAVAGIGAIATAYKLASAESERLTVSTDKLNQEWRDLVAHGRPLVMLQNQITKAMEEQGKAQAEVLRLQERMPGSAFSVGTPGEIALAQNELDAATRKVQQLQSTRPELVKENARRWVQAFLLGLRELRLDDQLARLTANRGEFESRGAEAAESWHRAFMEFMTRAPAIPVRVETPLDASLARGPHGERLTGRLPIPLPATPQLTALSNLVPSLGDPAFIRQALKETGAETKLFSEEITRLGGAISKSGHASQLAAAQMVTSWGNLIAGLLQGGGSAGGFLQSLGGALGLIKGFNPLIAAGVGAVGSIVSATENRPAHVIVDDFASRAEDKLKRTRGEPTQFDLIIVDQFGRRLERTEYEIARRSRRDAVTRLPPGGI